MSHCDRVECINYSRKDLLLHRSQQIGWFNISDDFRFYWPFFHRTHRRISNIQHRSPLFQLKLLMIIFASIRRRQKCKLEAFHRISRDRNISKVISNKFKLILSARFHFASQNKYVRRYIKCITWNLNNRVHTNKFNKTDNTLRSDSKAWKLLLASIILFAVDNK